MASGLNREGARDAGRIALLGLFGVGNLGNDVTLDVTLHHLRSRAPASQILCICANPRDVTATFGITAAALETLRPWSFWRLPGRLLRAICAVVATIVTEPVRRRRVARELAGARQLVVVGTGILDDFGEVPWQMPARLWRWCNVAKLIGSRVDFLAVGAGPITHPVSRDLMLRACRTADYRSFRDAVSREYMKGLGLDTAHDKLLPDLVFGFPEERLPPAQPASNPPRTVGVGLMGYYGWSDDRDRGQATYAGYISKISEFVAWLLSSGYGVRLLIGQRGADEQAVMDLRQAVRGHGHIDSARLMFETIASFDELLAQAANTDLVIASRYHNIIGALLLGRPVISIGYSSKFDDLMHQMGLEAYCQDIEQLNVSRLTGQFDSLLANQPRVVAGIQEKCREFRSRVVQGYDALWP